MDKLIGIRACVFDAYGTLFDVNSAARAMQDRLGETWPALAETWRAKQLQYTWLRGLAGRHADFWQVTGDALDFALQTHGFDDAGLRHDLMQLYLRLNAFPEVADTLRLLKAAGFKLAILSNGTPAMLQAAVGNAAIAELMDAILSVEEVGVYKPHPSVYQLAVDRLGVHGSEICFLSSNGWDAYSAKAFGFRVLWCNRYGQPPERIPAEPDAQIRSLAELPPLLIPG